MKSTRKHSRRSKRSKRSKHTRKMSGGKNYTKNVSEPWFTYIEEGKKTIEGRLSKGDFAEMKVGDHITFTNEEKGDKRSYTIMITEIKPYPTFETYLKESGLENCLPGVNSIEEGVAIYHQYYSVEEELQYGVRAIHMKKL
jgi:ASC-1-like (ASCH) protein